MKKFYTNVWVFSLVIASFFLLIAQAFYVGFTKRSFLEGCIWFKINIDKYFELIPQLWRVRHNGE